jgi:hypothetical protein
MPVVGLADETSGRGFLCGISLVRSSRRQPLTTACPGGDGLPQGGEEPIHLPVSAPDGPLISRTSLGTIIDGEVAWESLSQGRSTQTPFDIVGIDPLTLSGGGAENP